MGRYAARTSYETGEKKLILMHRQLLGAATWGEYVDHINGNTLDNRKTNLRKCSNAENVRNQRPVRARKSRYKGVSLKGRGTWVARITVQYKEIYIGSFVTEREAAIAYNEAAVKHFGQFANLNVIEVAA